MFNIESWEPYIRKQLMRQAELFIDSVSNRLLPTFENTDKEASEVEEQELERLYSCFGSPDTDPADLAERARDAGIDHYMMLEAVKQSLLNVAAVTLYHLFEQQLFVFLRREILHPSEENNVSLIKILVFKERCLRHGVDVEQFHSWPTINEMRLVANTVKHAEGTSANELRKIRPDLFINPILKDSEVRFSGNCRLYMPIGGEDLYLSVKDLDVYKRMIIDFWDTFIKAMRANN